MNKRKIKVYALFILLSEAVGAVAGYLTKDGMQAYESAAKSALTPPSAAFPIVWTILYALMGIGAAMVYLAPPSAERKRAVRLFKAQLAVNFLWSFIFFNMQAYGFAFIWLVFLWILVLLMIMSFKKVTGKAAYLQLPYLIWLSFAGYLNFITWLLNR